MLALAAQSSVVRAFSHGGGKQSTAVIVLQALGKLPKPYDYFIFSNVGEDSENPATLEYIERYTKPFAQLHGIRFLEVQKMRGRGQDKTPDTLLQAINRDNKTIIIPAYTKPNGGRLHRNCTVDYKIKVVDGWIKEHGYSWATVGMGISLDEFDRARDTNWYDHEGKEPIGFTKRREYQLIDLRLSRQDCIEIIKSVGLPEPPKSSCYFCPFRQRNEWIELRKDDPALFEKAVAVDHRLREKAVSTSPTYLHRDARPLEHAVAENQLAMFPELDVCETGYCMT